MERDPGNLPVKNHGLSSRDSTTLPGIYPPINLWSQMWIVATAREGNFPGGHGRETGRRWWASWREKWLYFSYTHTLSNSRYGAWAIFLDPTDR